MSLANLHSIIFRVLNDPNYDAPKLAELEWLELDGNEKILGDAIRELAAFNTDGIDIYDPGQEYSLDNIVAYDGNIWQYINPIPNTGVTPGTDSASWKLSSSGILSHQRNKDQYLDLGGDNEVSAEEIRALLDSTSILPAFAFCIANTLQITPSSTQGEIVWNNASQSSATSLFVAYLDRFGNGLGDYFDDSDIGDFIYLIGSSIGQYQKWQITSKDFDIDHQEFTVTNIFSGHDFEEGESVYFAFKKSSSSIDTDRLDPATPGVEDGQLRVEHVLDEVKTFDPVTYANGTEIGDKALLMAGTTGDWVDGHFTGDTINSLAGQWFPGKDVTESAWYMYFCITDNNWYRSPLTASLIDAYTKSESDARYLQTGASAGGGLTGTYPNPGIDTDVTPTNSSVKPVQSGGVKNYIDQLIEGLDWKIKADVRTTANITLSGIQTIDGRTGAADRRVLVMNQTTQTENGLYLMKSGAWVRTDDGSTGLELAFAVVQIQHGTLYAGKVYRCDQADITIGSTNITFTVWDLAAYIAGSGLVLTGNSFAIDTAIVATLTGAQVLTNKTLTSPVINVTSDATGDTYYRSSGGLFTRLAIGAANTYYKVVAGLPSWADFGADVRDTLLTGVSFVTTTAVVATDKLLVGIGKLQGQINDIVTNFATTVRGTLLTGLSTVTAQVVVATDSVLLAIGYIQAQLNLLNADRVYTIKVSLTSAQILNSFTTPIQLIPAPGAGKIIEVLNVFAGINFGTLPYLTNLTLSTKYGVAGITHFASSIVLTSTSSRIIRMSITAPSGTTGNQYLSNTAYMLTTGTGNPTAGDSTIDLYVTYKIASF